MLKKYFFILVSVIFYTMTLKADLIVLTDGTTIQVHNIDVSSKWVFYTETSDEDADIKKISIDQVFGYKIGKNPMTTVEVGTTTVQPKPQDSPDKGQKGKLTPIPAADNDALITAYNNHPALTRIGKKAELNKYTNFFLSLWGIEDGSILSDENVEIGFEKVYSKYDKNHKVIGNLIKVTNKTDSPIYIDLGSCYKIMNGGYSVPYFTNSVYREGSGVSSGESMNMGGVAGALGIGGVLGSLAGGLTIGGSTNHSSEISTVEQRIITVPPHSRVTLPGDKFSTGKKIIELYEPIYFYNKPWGDEIDLKKSISLEDAENLTIAIDQQAQKVADESQATTRSLNVRRWMQTDFTPENTPKKIGRVITYSTSPDFSTYTSLPVNLYMRGIFGVPISGGPLESGFRVPSYDDKNYDCIVDDEHFIVGRGYVKDK